MILSKKPCRKDIFKNGVPISIHRDVRINRILTKEQLYEILTSYGKNPIAQQISDYIIDELTLPINRDVKTVFLSGGFSETYGLIEYIQTKLKNNPLTSRLPLETFEARSSLNEMYPFQVFEDSTFAPAIGGAITSLMNYSYETCLSLSYVTWYRNSISNSVFRNE